jgi:hypothetical protein
MTLARPIKARKLETLSGAADARLDFRERQRTMTSLDFSDTTATVFPISCSSSPTFKNAPLPVDTIVRRMLGPRVASATLDQ